MGDQVLGCTLSFVFISLLSFYAESVARRKRREATGEEIAHPSARQTHIHTPFSTALRQVFDPSPLPSPRPRAILAFFLCFPLIVSPAQPASWRDVSGIGGLCQTTAIEMKK